MNQPQASPTPQQSPDETRGLGCGREGHIETYPSGTSFDPLDEHPDFKIEDIAHALGMCCRYNGHVSDFISVAEHCVMVSHIMGDKSHSRELAFEGLMHDAIEYVLTDVPAPFKQYLDDYRAFDAQLERKLRYHFNLNYDKSPLCKRADWLALFIEADKLTVSRGEKFSDPLGLRSEALTLADRYPVHNWDWAQAKHEFLKRYWELQAGRE